MRAQRVLRDFKLLHIGNYMQLCFLSNVALFADVFQIFRYSLLNEYQLDSAYYIRVPQIASNALCIYIIRLIHSITDQEMYRISRTFAA